MELTVSPFDYRTAARFWEVADERRAVQVHAIVGGTPAYRREFVRDDARRLAGQRGFDTSVTPT